MQAQQRWAKAACSKKESERDKLEAVERLWQGDLQVPPAPPPKSKPARLPHILQLLLLLHSEKQSSVLLDALSQLTSLMLSKQDLQASGAGKLLRQFSERDDLDHSVQTLSLRLVRSWRLQHAPDTLSSPCVKQARVSVSDSPSCASTCASPASFVQASPCPALLTPMESKKRPDEGSLEGKLASAATPTQSEAGCSTGSAPSEFKGAKRLKRKMSGH